MKTHRFFIFSLAALTTLGFTHSLFAQDSATHQGHTEAGMHAAPGKAAASPSAQIKAVMMKQFDRPDARLVVGPVTVHGNYAVAGWTQTGKGGRALLQKDKAQWVISVCAGDGLTRSDVLQTTGMDKKTADHLAQSVRAAESKLDKKQLALFASFEGMVKIDGASAHGHHGEVANHPKQ